MTAVVDEVVLDQLLGQIFEALLGGADVYAAPVDDRALALTASVSIAGEWPGHVAVSCSEEFARRFAAQLFLTEMVTDADVVDAIGELANVVGGNVKSVVPGPNVLSLPHVVRGTEYLPSAIETVRLDLTWADEPLRVAVWIAARPEGETE
jgi:chemotaxis protein CheX